jgi:hypothetical protein
MLLGSLMTLVAMVFLAATNICNSQETAAKDAKVATSAEAVPSGIAPETTSWGHIKTDSTAGWAQLTIKKLTATIALPTPLANITRAALGTPEWPGEFLPFSFNADASQISLHLPTTGLTSGNLPVSVSLLFAEQTQQFPSGRIVLSALDAEVVGDTAKLESHPGNHRIGFWSNAEDFVRWGYKATRAGNYDVQLTYSLAGEPGSDGSEIEVAIGDIRLPHKLTATGSWYRYTTVPLGTAYLAKPSEYQVTVKCARQLGGAVMNLKAITLIPTCEGDPPVQADDGTILLHAKDATANGILLQWEPNPKKRTLGYWANPNDFASWDFEVRKEGEFDVQIWQGCGAGQGGSTATFRFYPWGSLEPTTELSHTVKDTGHWQNFEPIELGTAKLDRGKYRLRVDATKKAKAAVMDLRQILLTPFAKTD